MLGNKRFDLVIDDGMKYVAKTDRRFDVIIVDSTDPHGPGKVLFSPKFYAACKRCMKPGGVMVTQNGVPILQSGELTAGISKFRKLFADGSCYVAAIPTYVGGHMAMGWATDNKALRQTPLKTIADALQEGRQLQDQVLDAGGPQGGLRAAALHRRAREERKEALMADAAAASRSALVRATPSLSGHCSPDHRLCRLVRSVCDGPARAKRRAVRCPHGGRAGGDRRRAARCHRGRRPVCDRICSCAS